MEIEAGVCELCSTEDKVIKPPQAETIVKSLGSLLKNQINKSEFNKIRSSLKVCPKCLQHLVISKNAKSIATKTSPRRGKTCNVCLQNNNLVVMTDWPTIENVLSDMYTHNVTERILCLECILCLTTLESMKGELLQRYPSLNQDNKTVISPERLNTSSLKHLTPLKNTELNLEEDIKSDSKFMNQVLYINMGTKSEQENNETKKWEVESPRKSGRKRKRDSGTPSPPESHRKRKKRSISPASSISSQSSQEDAHTRDSESSQDEGGIQKRPSFFKIKLKMHAKPRTKLKKKDPSYEAELSRYNITKVLKVNLAQIDLNSSTKEEDLNQEELVVKKRKSVSFADDKNVQIEYTEYPNSMVNRTEESGIVAKTILKKTMSSLVAALNEDSSEEREEENPDQNSFDNEASEQNNDEEDQENSHPPVQDDQENCQQTNGGQECPDEKNQSEEEILNDSTGQENDSRDEKQQEEKNEEKDEGSSNGIAEPPTEPDDSQTTIGVDEPAHRINGSSLESEILEEATNLSNDIIAPPDEMHDIPKEDPISLARQAGIGNLDAVTLPCVADADKEFDEMTEERGEVLTVNNGSEALGDPIVTDELLDGQLRLNVLPEDIMDDALIK